MAYDEKLAQRIRDLIGDHPALTEKKMFGGIAFLIGGNMSVGVNGPELMVRADPAAEGTLLKLPGARPMDFTGRPMKGWLTVAPDGLKTTAQLQRWVEASVSHAESFPAKTGTKKMSAKKTTAKKTTAKKTTAKKAPAKKR